MTKPVVTKALMFYQIFGQGEKVFLLIHNAGGDHQFLAPQIAMLSAFATVIAVDLPGHGKSKAYADQAYTLESYAQAIVDLCESLHVSPIIGVGLNYGANIFIECVSKNPALFEKLILIDPPVLMQEPVKTLVNQHIQTLRDPCVRDHAERTVVQAFIHTTQANKTMALKVFKQIEASVLISVYENLLIWDQSSDVKIQVLSLPTLCILTDGALCSASDLIKHNARIKIGKVVESLYWATLEVPEQVNAMIRRFLALDP